MGETKELTIRRYDETDFDTLKVWWDHHKFEGMVPAMLPRIGYVVEGVCAGFLYQTDSAFALFEWVISNTESDKEIRRAGLDLLITAAAQEAQNLGFKVLYSTIKHPALIARYKSHGYVETDTGMTAMVRGL
jgi:hypothetical protein